MSSTYHLPEMLIIPIKYIREPWFQTIKYPVQLLNSESQKANTGLAVPGVLTFYHCIAQTVGLDEEFSSCESYKIQGGEEVDVP